MSVTAFRISQVKVAGSKVANVENAALAVAINTGETTGLGDDWRKLVVLGKQATLSLAYSQNHDDTAQELLASEFISGDSFLSSLRMYYETSHYLFCSAMFIASWSVTEAVGAANKVSVTLESGGQISKGTGA